MKTSSVNKKIFEPIIHFFCFGFVGSNILNYHTVIDSEYNSLFTRYKGWTGGDITHTIPLTDSITLWQFGDSWIYRPKFVRIKFE
jgi:hypothetical protein